MSTTGYSTHQQTRQQLDELDALLQRMLSIPPAAEPSSALSPMSDPDTVPDTFAPLPPTLPPARVFPQPTPTPGAEPVVHAWRVEVPAATASSSQSPPLALPVDGAAPLPIDPRTFAPPPAAVPAGTPALSPPPYPYSMVFGPPVVAEPGMPVPPTTGAAAPPLPGQVATPQWHAPRAAEPAPLPFLLLPLLAFNRLFDVVTFFLGPLGSWLRRPEGRNTLGWLGILMILAAIGWGVADWYGIEWTR